MAMECADFVLRPFQVHLPRSPAPFVHYCAACSLQQALFGFKPEVTALIEFDHVDKRPTRPANPNDKRASEALPIFEGSEVRLYPSVAIACCPS